MIGSRHRLLAAALLASVALGTEGTPAAQAGTSTCRVRNVTQDTGGRSFAKVVVAAHDGDRLRVRGVCTSRDVRIDVDLSIRGVGHDRAVLTGTGDTRVLRVAGDTVAMLRHLKLTDGSAQSGGAILNRGDLTLLDSIVQASHASGGGGILTRGRLRLIDSVVRGNQAWSGGGIHVADGTARLRHSRVTDNAAADQGAGGGILNEARLTVVGSVIDRNRVDFGGGAGIASSGILSLADSTVKANTAGSFDADLGGGGGIQNSGSLSLTGSNVVGNSIGGVAGGGGGIYNWSGSGTVTLDPASVVIGNTPDDCVGTPAC
jgi:hypothetical protein